MWMGDRQAGSNGVIRSPGITSALPSLDRNLRLDRQTVCGLTGAHGLIATTPEPNAENRGAVCS